MNESKGQAAVLAESGNFSVVHLEGRRYPAVAVQGDSLKVLHEAVEELSGYLRSGDLAEAKFSFAEIQATISSLKSFYERTLRDEGVGLPYIAE
ncbi:DUF6959 family protein [Streptomyces sp. NBC_01506]|uniref:DUF6959 family protein n=1 Tax=Streptomyces sp. NBC_01506 TaxID=2903887 RepID=UPI00386FF88B